MSPESDTWGNAIKIAGFLSANIPHANQTVKPKDITAIGLWNYHKTVEPGLNCMYHSIMLHEILRSVGIIDRVIRCLPRDSTDQDCHVVNHVWLPEHEKWAMIDSDQNSYMEDSNGVPMSVDEMRRDFMGDNVSVERPLTEEVGRPSAYKSYFAKNLYWFESIRTAGYNLHDGVVDYVCLVPKGFEGFRYEGKVYELTSDAASFWASPVAD